MIHLHFLRNFTPTIFIFLLLNVRGKRPFFISKTRYLEWSCHHFLLTSEVLQLFLPYVFVGVNGLKGCASGHFLTTPSLFSGNLQVKLLYFLHLSLKFISFLVLPTFGQLVLNSIKCSYSLFFFIKLLPLFSDLEVHLRSIIKISFFSNYLCSTNIIITLWLNGQPCFVRRLVFYRSLIDLLFQLLSILTSTLRFR